MYEATLNLQLDGECVLTTLAEDFEEPVEIEVLELHDSKVTCIIHSEENTNEYYTRLTASEHVEHVERLGDDAILITKPSCGASPAVQQNNGVLRRQNRIDQRGRVYNILAFQHEDLTNIIKDFQSYGTVTVESLTEFPGTEPDLTGRQREVVQTALEAGYFEWPREISSEDLAAKLDITRGTCLEHLRKAESKLLREAVDSLDTLETAQ